MATKQKNCLISMTLTNITVKNAVKSYTMSKSYINTMLRITVINILYHRLQVDKKEFIRREFNKIEFYTSKKTSKNLLIQQYDADMLACKDALQKNYLRQFYMYFLNTKTKDIIEYYKFTFSYASRGEHVQMSQIEERLYENTSEVLQVLQKFKEYEKLNEDVEVQVELAYFNDTPDDYEPPGFAALDETESLARKLERKGNVATIGSLDTSIHKLNCDAKFLLNNTRTSNRDKAHSQDNSDVIVIDDDEQVDISQKGTSFPPQDNQDIISISSDDENDSFDCPCKIKAKYDMLWSPDIITCLVCHQSSHTACQGYLDNTFVDGLFKCEKCKERTADDEDSSSLSLCRMRYMLGGIYKLSRVPTAFEQLFGDAMMQLKKMAINMEDRRKGTLNMDIVQKLFNCLYKAPVSKRIIHCK